MDKFPPAGGLAEASHGHIRNSLHAIKSDKSLPPY